MVSRIELCGNSSFRTVSAQNAEHFADLFDDRLRLLNKSNIGGVVDGNFFGKKILQNSLYFVQAECFPRGICYSGMACL
jgi:hypothetical protein